MLGRVWAKLGSDGLKFLFHMWLHTNGQFGQIRRRNATIKKDKLSLKCHGNTFLAVNQREKY